MCDEDEEASLLPIPTMTPGYLGLPTTEGNTARGASSPAKPALTMPDPLSITNAAASSSSSHIFAVVVVGFYKFHRSNVATFSSHRSIPHVSRYRRSYAEGDHANGSVHHED